MCCECCAWEWLKNSPNILVRPSVIKKFNSVVTSSVQTTQLMLDNNNKPHHHHRRQVQKWFNCGLMQVRESQWLTDPTKLSSTDHEGRLKDSTISYRPPSFGLVCPSLLIADDDSIWTHKPSSQLRFGNHRPTSHRTSSPFVAQSWSSSSWESDDQCLVSLSLGIAEYWPN